MYLTNRSGLSISSDSANYFIAARNLLSTGTVTYFDGSPLSAFPPGYPILLAATSWLLNLSIESSALVMSIAASFLVPLATGHLTAYLVSEKNGRVASIAAILASVIAGLSYPTVRSLSFAWSEGPFIVVILLGALFLRIGATRRNANRWLFVAIATFTIAPLVRTSGLIFAAAAILLGLFVYRSKWRLLVIAAGAAAGSAVNILIHQLVDAGTGFARGLPAESVVQIVGRSLYTFATWHSFGALGVSAAIGALLGAAFLFIFGTIALMCHRRNGALFRDLSFPLFFALAYYCGMVVVKMFSAMDALGDRLLYPLFPFTCIAVARLAASFPPRWRRRSAVLLTLFSIVPGAIVASQRSNVQDPISAAIGSSCSGISHADILYSNYPSLVAWHCGRNSLEVPRERLYQSIHQLDEVGTFVQRMNSSCAVVVWAGGARFSKDHHVDLGELHRRLGLSAELSVQSEEIAILDSCSD
jgi:hypothetical protein